MARGVAVSRGSFSKTAAAARLCVRAWPSKISTRDGTRTILHPGPVGDQVDGGAAHVDARDAQAAQAAVPAEAPPASSKSLSVALLSLSRRVSSSRLRTDRLTPGT